MNKEEFNPRAFIAIASIVAVSLIGMFLIAINGSKDTESEEDFINKEMVVKLSKEASKNFVESAENFIEKAGTFGFLELDDLDGKELWSLKSNPDESAFLSRMEVYESLKIPSNTPLYNNSNKVDSNEISALTAFTVSDISVTPIRSWWEGGKLYTKGNISFVSSEQRYVSEGDSITKVRILKVRNDFPVKGEIVLTQSKDDWVIYDVDVDKPFVLVTWNVSNEFVDERLQQGNILDTISVDLDSE